MAEPEEPSIDWVAMTASETWRYQVLPLLRTLREASVARLLLTRDPIELQYLRGQAAAYDDLMTLPARAIERERVLRAEAEEERARQEESDERRRRRAGPAWSHRWHNRLRAGGE